MTQVMSLAAALDRVAMLQQMLSPAPVVTATAAQPTTFNSALTSATATPAATGPVALASTATGGTPAGQAALAAAEAEVGVAEQPPGSNDSPRIAQYRQATAGSPGPGPWCAYFASWACRQAGTPIGENGTGGGSVDGLYAWAQRVGRAEGSSYTPKPGDLIVWDEHIGVVESVLPDGSVKTIEGNSSDQVSRRTHPKGDALGFIRTT